MAKKPAEPQRLPVLSDGEVVSIVKLDVREKATRPPKLYTEGTLVDDMVAAGKYVDQPELRAVSGLGTAATRDSIIETLRHHRYLTKDGNAIVPTDKGTTFIHWLRQVCPELADIALTAQWETKLNVVALRGGGPQFEDEVARYVERLVDKLRGATPITQLNPNLKPNNMSEQARTNKPTQKMLDFASRIAQRKGEELPAEARESFDACSQYIDANKEAAMRPTEKQVGLAERIARDKGLQIPAEARSDGRALSRWIDENR